MLCQFLLYSSTNQHQAYIYPLPLEPPSHAHLHATPPGHHRARSWAPHATQQLPNSRRFYTQQCVHVNATLSIHLTPPFSLCVYKSKSSMFVILLFPGQTNVFPQLGFLAFVNMTWKLQHKKKQNKTKRAETIFVFLKKVKAFNIQ